MATLDNPLIDRLKSWPLYALPHHLLSRVIFWLTRRKTTLAHPVMRLFAKTYGVNMQEAAQSEFEHYASFNEFFTRELKSSARVVAADPNTIVSPVDGAVSQCGNIHDDQLFQAKGHTYSLTNLLGAEEQACTAFHGGRFATLYLSPRDYHRIHMPVDGTLRKMIHIPGRLFSVAPHTVRTVPNLFARNERVVCLFDTPAGPMSMVLVGAINVAAIETVWHGLVTPPTRKDPSAYDYSEDGALNLEKGAEMGRFNMGSTVILLTGSNITFNTRFAAEQSIRMGESIGTFNPD
ncbi:MAG: archaetidylserine decarboxylase [Pseudomonadota bacterium]